MENILIWLGLKLIRRKNIAAMHIYYQESFFRANSKTEFIGFTEFLCKYELFVNMCTILTI